MSWGRAHFYNLPSPGHPHQPSLPWAQLGKGISCVDRGTCVQLWRRHSLAGVRHLPLRNSSSRKLCEAAHESPVHFLRAPSAGGSGAQPWENQSIRSSGCGQPLLPTAGSAPGHHTSHVWTVCPNAQNALSFHLAIVSLINWLYFFREVLGLQKKMERKREFLYPSLSPHTVSPIINILH